MIEIIEYVEQREKIEWLESQELVKQYQKVLGEKGLGYVYWGLHKTTEKEWVPKIMTKNFPTLRM